MGERGGEGREEEREGGESASRARTRKHSHSRSPPTHTHMCARMGMWVLGGPSRRHTGVPAIDPGGQEKRAVVRGQGVGSEIEVVG